MTKSRFLVAVCGGLVLTGLVVGMVISAAQAQAPAAPPATGIALLDVSRIFKESTKFNALKADMMAQVQAAEGSVKTERDTLQGLAAQLQDLKPGTTQYKELEQEIASRSATLQVGVKLQQKNFLEVESGIYHQVYQDLQYEVESLARQYNIGVVIRYSGDDVDADQPDSVLRDINKQIVWHSESLDITGSILQRLNARTDPRISERPRSPGGYGLPSPN